MVAFSTDEELMEALGYVSDGIFKVYITTMGKSSSQNVTVVSFESSRHATAEKSMTYRFSSRFWAFQG